MNSLFLFRLLNPEKQCKEISTEKEKNTSDVMQETKKFLSSLNTKMLLEGKEILVYGKNRMAECDYYLSMNAKKTVWVCPNGDISKITAEAKKHALDSRFLALCEETDMLPYPDACFDTVILDGVIENEDEPDIILKEAARLLRKDGNLCVAFHPFLSFYGGGRRDILVLPHSHLIFRERTVAEAYRSRYGNDSEKLSAFVKTKEDGTPGLIGYPKLTIGKMKAILSELPLEEVTEVYYGSKGTTNKIRSLPVLNEIINQTAVFVYRATGK